MSRLQQIRNLHPAEVARIHRVHAIVGANDEKAIELLADMRAYCGRAWPSMLRQAVERYEATHRGDDAGSPPRSA